MTIRKRDKFPMKLKILRMELGKTQQEVAKTVGISRACLANYETGKRAPDWETLKRIAYTLGVSIDFLVSCSEVYNTTLSEPDLKLYQNASDELQKHGNCIYLNEVNLISRIELMDYYQYLKKKEARANRKEAT